MYFQLYDTALLTLMFTHGHQYTEQHFIYCVQKPCISRQSQHFNPKAVSISITFLPNHSLVNSLCFPVVGADTWYYYLSIWRGIHAYLVCIANLQCSVLFNQFGNLTSYLLVLRFTATIITIIKDTDSWLFLVIISSLPLQMYGS